MSEFGDFGNIDIDKLLSGADENFKRMQELQERINALVAGAQSDDGLVRAEYTTLGGLTELVIDSRAMRKPAGELAETVKAVIREAGEDLQRQSSEIMAEVFGEDDNPMKVLQDPEAAMKQVQEAQAAYDRVMDDAFGELDRIRRRMGL